MILSLVAVLVMVGLSIENFMFAMQPRVIDNKSVIKKIVTSTIKLSDSVKNTAVSQTDYNIYIVTSNSLPYLYWKSVLYKDFNDFEVSTSTIISSSKKLLLKLNKDFELIQPAYSSDRQLMIFTILNAYNFSTSTFEYIPLDTNGIYIYQYNNEIGKWRLLFTGKEFIDTKYPETKYKYFYPREISSDKNYVFFYVTNCFSCGPGYIGVIYDIKNDEFKNLDLICDFKWSNGTEYKYKECVWDEKCNGEICFKDPKDLPWKYGKF